MSTTDILIQITELRRQITATTEQQNRLWSHPDYPSIDDGERDELARGLYTPLTEWDLKIEALALQVTTASPQWPGGWLLGSSCGRGEAAWIGPWDIDRWATLPAWRDQADAEAVLAELRPPRPSPTTTSRRPMAGFTPARPMSWYPPAIDGDTGDYRVCWVGATRNRVITVHTGFTVAREMPLDQVGWDSLTR